jgi:hypothetical protein
MQSERPYKNLTQDGLQKRLDEVEATFFTRLKTAQSELVSEARLIFDEFSIRLKILDKLVGQPGNPQTYGVRRMVAVESCNSPADQMCSDHLTDE